jgi:hypothetical protein
MPSIRKFNPPFTIANGKCGQLRNAAPSRIANFQMVSVKKVGVVDNSSSADRVLQRPPARETTLTKGRFSK